MKTNVAVIGSGYWGKNLLRNFHELDALRMICDRDESVLTGFKKLYRNIDVCSSFNDVLKRKDINGVAIATPAETHYALAREALLSGKHVFVEKPFVLHESEAQELIAISEDQDSILMVGHLLQYHPVFIRLKELVANGKLGRINYIYSHRLNLGKIRREENALWSFAPHDISMILSLAGEEPESILTTGGNYLHQKIADVTTTHLEFPSGIKAHIFVSWLHPFKDQKLVVVGDKKMAVFDDTQPWAEKLLVYPHEINWSNGIPVPAKAKPEKVNSIPEREPLRMECEHFLECIREDNKPVTDGREGLRVLKVLNASQQSLNKDGERITYPQIVSRTSKPFFVHPTAVVDSNVQIGKGTKIWHFSHVISNTVVGENCNIGQNVVIGPDVKIGNGCKVQNNVSIYKGVVLEDHVFCGPSMVFTNVYNPRAEIRKMDEARPTLVRKGATIGANATIVCGNTIGSYAFIGAGAVVTKNVADFALMVGNPARQIGWVCYCGERLTGNLECLSCRKKFRKYREGLKEKILSRAGL